MCANKRVNLNLDHGNCDHVAHRHVMAEVERAEVDAMDLSINGKMFRKS